MPSVAGKVENTKVSSDSGEGMKNVLNFVEKKIRNLEKRKNKLEDYQKRKNKGEDLGPQQQEALDAFPAVLNNLEFAKEFSVMVSSTIAEAEKASRKAEKRAKVERDKQHQESLRTVLSIQALLEEMGVEETRAKFTQPPGQDDVLLKEEEVTALDDLYQAVTPRREESSEDGVSWPEKLTKAADTWCALLDARDKPLNSSNFTFKQANELVTRLSNISFFKADTVPSSASTSAEVPAPVIAQEPAEVVTHKEPSIQEPVHEVDPSHAQMNGGHYYHNMDEGRQPGARRSIRDISQEVANKHQFNFIQDSELPEPAEPRSTGNWADEPVPKDWGSEETAWSQSVTTGSGDVFSTATKSDFLKENSNEWSEAPRGRGARQQDFRGGFRRPPREEGGYSRGGFRGGSNRGNFRGGRGAPRGSRGSGGGFRSGSGTSYHRGGFQEA